MKHSLSSIAVLLGTICLVSCTEPAAVAQDGSSDTPAAKVSQPASAVTDAELAEMPRDLRRTKIIEGFTCERMIQGQPGYVKYLKNGRGLVGHQAGDADFRWEVKSDQLCIRTGAFDEKCNNLPARDFDNEREWLLTALGKSCL